MKRRDVLRRAGAVGLGVGTAGLGLGAFTESEEEDDVRFDGAIVQGDGSVYVYKDGVDADVVPTEDCCSCDSNGATDCSSECDCCEYCHAK